jgi:hypothetical protein
VNSPEFVLILNELDGTLERIVMLEGQQRAGVLDRHAASVQKQKLVATIRTVHLPHLAQAGQKASRTVHELATAFRFKPSGDAMPSFRAAVGTMLAEAQRHQEVMVKEGLSPAVLADLEETLKALDAAIELGQTARAALVGASAELRVLGDEVVRLVRLLDAVNQLAFRDKPELLAAWQSVSRVQPNPSSAEDDESGEGGSTPTPGGDVRPAA